MSDASGWGDRAGHDCTNDRAIMLTTTTSQPSRTITPHVAAGALTAGVVAAGAVTAGGVVIAIRLAPISLAVLAAMVPLAAAAVVDARDRRLPNRLVVLSAVPVAMLCVLDPFVGRLSAIGSVGMGAVLLAGPLLGLHLIAPAAMGFGDVKAACSLGATLGLIGPELSMWTLCIACGVTGGWGLARRQRHVALGPGLVLAALAVLVVSAVIGVQVIAWR
jgi:leader peptidase (prepilin peptidase)/N-methyltransferase